MAGTREEHDTPATIADHDSRPARPSFVVGECLAGRYQLERFIAQGGMGEVYAAEDRVLGEHVAVKTIRAEIAGDLKAVARFRREIQLAHKVTHRNVCRVFDVVDHATPEGRVPFLTMELLEGQTLAERLASGPMTTAEALPIVAQLCAGLDAAHEVGVLHRDFKSQNVILVAAPAGAVRAVVTDFGLACLSSSELASTDARVTRHGALIGTPAYMAPEQVSGEPVTAAADVYALGVVMYEMVTGALPFDAGDGVATARRRLDTSPPSPRARVPELDPRWEAAILRCLARDPSQRFARAGEIVAALTGKPARRGRRAITVAALVTLAVTVAALAVRGRPAPRALGRRPVVALLDLTDDAGSDTAWLGTAITSSLSAGLTGAGEVRVIDAIDIGHARREHAEDDLGLDHTISGSFGVGQDGTIRLRLDLASTGSQSHARFDLTGTLEDVPTLAEDAARTVLEHLGADPRVAGGARSVLPHDPRALRALAEGWARSREMDLVRACHFFEQAVALDPNAAIARLALGDCAEWLGDRARAKLEMARARELSSSLPDELRQYVEARYQFLSDRIDPAIAGFRQLHAVQPHDTVYAQGLIDALMANGLSRDAFAAVDRMREGSRTLALDPLLDMAEANVALQASDWQRALDAATRAAIRARADGRLLVYADARLAEGWARTYLLQSDEARRALDEAREIFVRMEVPRREADATHYLSNWYFVRGELRTAVRLQLDSMDIFRRLGMTSQVALDLSNLALHELALGEMAAALTYHVAAHALPKNQMLDLVRDLWLARIQLIVGDLEDARHGLSKALTMASMRGARAWQAQGHQSRIDLFIETGERAAARQEMEAFDALLPWDGARAIWRLLLRTRLAISEGRFADAEATAGGVLSLMSIAKVSAPSRHSAEALACEAALLNGDLPSAAAFAARVSAGMSRQEDGRARAFAETVVARVRATSRRPADVAAALAALETTRAWTSNLGLFQAQLEARLAMGQIELSMGRASGRTRLATVAKDARTRGYIRIALLAEVAR